MADPPDRLTRREVLGALGGAAVTALALDPAEAARRPPCVPTGPLPQALLTCRNWITFAPPRPFDPDRGLYPRPAQLRTALRQLAREGWRGIVTYSMDGSLGLIPRLARQAGFRKVIAGLFWFDDAQLQRERAAALRQAKWIDGYVLGNEGLQFGRYTRERLETELHLLKTETHRPATTSEPHGQYTAGSGLAALGDWVFPNIHPWFAGIRSVPEAVQFVQDAYAEVAALAPGRAVAVKEAWWPSAGGTGAGTAAQVQFFRALAASPVKFIWGEAYNEFWKTGEGSQGPHWGFHTAARRAKPIVASLRGAYTGRY